jgi:hypothetical protein
MPYIPAPDGLTKNIEDVYHSGNVYANFVPIALWQDGAATATAAAITAYIANPQFAADQTLGEETEGNTDEAAVDARTAELIKQGVITQEQVTAGSQAGNNAKQADTAPGVVNNGSTATVTISADTDNIVLYVSPAAPAGTGKTYKVKDVTKQPGVVFPYDVASIAPQNGTTVEVVVQNLANLVKNCFDPIKKKYPDAFMTCSFRAKGVGSSTSQHPFGMACDIQYSQASKAEYFVRAQWVRDNIAYDQFILEYKTTGTGKPWHHISFNAAGNKGQVLTFMNDKNCKGPGVTGLYDLSNA